MNTVLCYNQIGEFADSCPAFPILIISEILRIHPSALIWMNWGAVAQKQEKLPVLGFCRSLGRVPWMVREREGFHIVTWRNPWDQWVSYHRQSTRRRIGYFECMALKIAIIAHQKFPKFFQDISFPSLSEDVGKWRLVHLLQNPAGNLLRFRIFLRGIYVEYPDFPSEGQHDC